MRIRPRSTLDRVMASSKARRGDWGASAWRWKGRLCLIGADACTGSTSRAAHMFARELGPNGRDSGCLCCHLEYSWRRSKVRLCCKYGGRTTDLSRASRGSWTRRSHALRVTKANSRFLEISRSWTKLSNRVMASLKEPAFRTCSQVKVVKLAVGVCQQQLDCAQLFCARVSLTAQGCDWGVDRLHQNVVVVELWER